MERVCQQVVTLSFNEFQKLYTGTYLRIEYAVNIIGMTEALLCIFNEQSCDYYYVNVRLRQVFWSVKSICGQFGFIDCENKTISLLQPALLLYLIFFLEREKFLHFYM